MRSLSLVCILGALAVPTLGFAQLKESVNFRGQASKDIAGRLKGQEYVDYLVDVKAGQSVVVELRGNVFFNFNAPKSDLSMFNGSVGGSKMEPRMVPSDGQYIIRVYQMGAAKSENRSVSYDMTIRIKGTGYKPVPGRMDAKIAGSAFHAMGPVPCELNGKSTKCNAYVIRRDRSGSGTATVEFRAGSVVRRVLFVKGKPMASDSGEAFSFINSGDDTIVRFGDDPTEQFTVPDALIYGG